MADVLAHQQRIRSDPKVQALRRQVHEESMRFVRLVSACLFLLPIVGWSVYVVAAGEPWNLALKNQIACAMYAAWVFSIVLLYAVIARD